MSSQILQSLTTSITSRTSSTLVKSQRYGVHGLVSTQSPIPALNDPTVSTTRTGAQELAW